MSNEHETPRLRFPRAYRLTRTSEFAEVKNGGSVARGKLLILGWREEKGATAFRAGFVTSKRVGGAAVRNRVRRRLREVIRRHQHQVRSGFWMVLIARPASAGASYRALEDEWLRLAKRALILAPSCS